MQEEVENRTLTLVVSGTKFTGRMFKAAISKYVAHRKEKKLEKQRSRDAPVVPHVKQLSLIHISFKFMVKGLKSIIILLLFTACFSVFFTPVSYTHLKAYPS